MLRGVDLALVGGLDLAPICWLLVFFFFLLIVDVGRWVLILIGLPFLVHWWVLMILPPIGWVMIWLGGDDGGDGGCGSVRERGS